ncbi:hypothetical protein CM19_01835 [Candidatus Acidianus copahuensis]|uniref:Uncharacterized protein n=1 Tax=Candidatus Acidianus copahuensis TaxID=1160895 RepID=A0A031LU08_9CREN|nr:hypothetical protein [Candidatus Acidianus copahuensis]EZQ11245.1 hypothetical protein CM19_01835 [Candidatus Acidianus copahuensis]
MESKGILGKVNRNTPVLISAAIEEIILMGAFVAGITALLNDQFPITASWMAALLSAHLSFAVLSGLGGVLLFVVTYLSDRKDLFYLGLINVIFIGIAAANGLMFYATYNYDYSYTMAISFIFAIICTSGCIAWSI